MPQDCCQAKWNSIYFGGSVGYGFAATRFDEQHADAVTSGSNSLDLGGHNVTGTVVVGLDREVSRGLIIGAFADYTFGELTSSFSLDYLTSKVQLQYSDTWAVGGRIGVTRSCC